MKGSENLPTGKMPVVMFLAKTFQSDPRPRQEARTLVEAGYAVYVLAWDQSNKFHAKEVVDGAIVRSYHHMSLAKDSDLRLLAGAAIFQILIFFGAVRLVLQLRKRPVIHAHDFNTLLPAVAMVATGLAARLVYDCHELSYAVYAEWFNIATGVLVRKLEEKALAYVDAIFTVSDPIAGYLRLFNRNITVIYNCAMTRDIPNSSMITVRRELGLPLDAFIISYVGTLRRDSTLGLLIEVASYIHDANFRFIIIGDGPSATEFWKAVEERHDSRLIVIGRVGRDRALHYVLSSNLTWAVYDSAGLSLNSRIGLPWKFSESIACGVPVIVEGRSLRAKLAQMLGCGVIIDDRSPEHVSKILVSVARDENAYNELRLAARKASKDFVWEATSKKMLEIYEQVSSD